jgi:hypothetical protein
MIPLVRTLPVLAAFCWVAPLPAQQSGTATDHESGCPYARAEAEHAEEVIVVKTDAPLLDHHAASALLP